MGILKSELPKEGKVIIEVYEYTDPYKGFGHGKTLKFIEVDVADLVKRQPYKNMMFLPDEHNISFDEGYDIVTREEAQAKVAKLNKVLKETEELKLNLLRLL